MNVVYINQFFYPDSAATSQYLTDVVHALPGTVICGAGGYAEADAGPAPPGDVVRVHNRRFGRSVAQRVASYATFSLGATRRALRVPRPDVVVTLTTPPFIGLIGTLLKKLRGSRHVLWEMDVYPDIASEAAWVWPAAALANWMRRNADAVIVLGECMQQRLLAHGVPPEKIHIAENWADGLGTAPLPLPSGPELVVTYSGNFGLAHDLDTVRDAIAALREDARFRFVFAGGGRLREQLRSFCGENGLDAVEFPPYCARAELGRQLGAGHVGLVTLRARAVGSVVPSKAYGILAAGRPVLFVGPGGSEVARMIARFGCGWCVAPGDTRGLVELLRRLAEDRAEIAEKGERARRAFEAHYTRELGVGRIVRIIEACGGAEEGAAAGV